MDQNYIYYLSECLTKIILLLFIIFLKIFIKISFAEPYWGRGCTMLHGAAPAPHAAQKELPLDTV
jgi:hypothetical protein